MLVETADDSLFTVQNGLLLEQYMQGTSLDDCGFNAKFFLMLCCNPFHSARENTIYNAPLAYNCLDYLITKSQALFPLHALTNAALSSSVKPTLLTLLNRARASPIQSSNFCSSPLRPVLIPPL